MRTEKILAEHTNKREGLDVDSRVFYTLTDVPQLQAHRNAKLLALLVRHLHAKGVLDDEAIDTMLLQLVP